jgi:beta-lactamase class A
MRLFGGKKKEEEEEPRKRTFSKPIEKKELSEKEKFFKDKKERKNRFEIKPWTKVERLFVVGVFASTVAASGILAMSAREWKLPNLPRFSAPQILPSETIIVEKDEEPRMDSEVIKKFKSLTDPLSGVYGFFVYELDSDNYYGVNEKETFEAGSLNKLPVMLTMYKSAEDGDINLSTSYILRESDKIAGSGSLYGKPAGTKITYEELVRYMGHESDNTAFGIVKRILGDEKILKLMDSIGMSGSLLTDNETTPYEIGSFFKTLLDAKVVSRETRDAILEFLTNTTYENWIAKGIPVPVAHKFGTLPHVRNDAGVVMAQKPYILVVMSKGAVEKEADEVIPQISEMIYAIENSSGN